MAKKAPVPRRTSPVPPPDHGETAAHNISSEPCSRTAIRCDPSIVAILKVAATWRRTRPAARPPGRPAGSHEQQDHHVVHEQVQARPPAKGQAGARLIGTDALAAPRSARAMPGEEVFPLLVDRARQHARVPVRRSTPRRPIVACQHRRRPPLGATSSSALDRRTWSTPTPAPVGEGVVDRADADRCSSALPDASSTGAIVAPPDGRTRRCRPGTAGLPPSSMIPHCCSTSHESGARYSLISRTEPTHSLGGREISSTSPAAGSSTATSSRSRTVAAISSTASRSAPVRHRDRPRRLVERQQ